MRYQKVILAVRIDPEITRYLENFLALLGNYELHEASRDLEAWAKINALEPLLVIVSEPFLSKEIQRKYPEIPILIAAETPKPSALKDLSQKIKSLLPLEETSQQEQEYARLLVADDEPGINELITELLEPTGVEIYAACDGEEALQVFKNNRCNLALVDLRMPKMHGAELIQLLKASDNPSPPKSILVMCAGLGDNFVELKRLAHSVLTKPIDFETLTGKVLEACKKYGLALHREKIF